jgi:Co/Zn/Cd efflux system component
MCLLLAAVSGAESDAICASILLCAACTTSTVQPVLYYEYVRWLRACWRLLHAGCMPAAAAAARRRACGLPLVVPTMLQAPGKQAPPTTCCFGGVLTPNAKILLVSMSFFTTITIAQVFAAIAANSNALMADCVSMGVDALSYSFNIVSEAWPSADKRKQERNQLAGAIISLGLLLGFTLSFMLEAIGTISDADGMDTSCCDKSWKEDVDDPAACRPLGVNQTDAQNKTSVVGGLCLSAVNQFNQDAPAWENEKVCLKPKLHDGSSACEWTGVDPRIVCCFALFGLLFDLGSLWAFKHWGQKMSHLVGVDVAEGEEAAQKKTEQLNMSSALLHVLSDCMRSTTTLIESILIFVYPNTPSYIFDGWATLLVTASIMCGGLLVSHHPRHHLPRWLQLC